MTSPSPRLGDRAALVRRAFIEACHAELRALKPGNVHIHAGGHGMEVAHFEAAASAAAPAIADPTLRVGERIRRAVEASMAVAGCNTNLGILLLCAPLAAAFERATSDTPLRETLRSVLAALDAQDAADVFAAIRLANPGGLGKVEAADVASPPAIPLLDAMALAAPRDRIAAAYVSAFAEIFERALPALAQARTHAASSDLAVTTLHMALLSSAPDSHILRKYGSAVAELVRSEASRLSALVTPCASARTLPGLLEFDRHLKGRGINPGTTADLVVATLFTERLQKAQKSGNSRAEPA